MNISLMFLMVGAITDRSLSGQEKVFAAKLYTEYYPLIRSRATKLTGNATDRDDLIHDSYLQLLVHIDRLTGLEQPQLIRYIERVIMTCFHRLNKGNIPVSYEEIAPILPDEESPDMQEGIEQKEACRVFHEQFGKLSYYDQRLLYLRYIEELSLAEIGERLQIKPASVNTQLCRVRKRAQLLMKEMHDEKYSRNKEDTK